MKEVRFSEAEMSDIYLMVAFTGDKKRVLEQRDYAEPTFTPRSALAWLRQKAFWAAGLLTDALTNEVKGVLLNALKTGAMAGETIERIMEVFAPYLLSGAQDELLPAHRLETIVRTNTTEAYNHGRLTEMLDPDLLPFLDGVRYSAVLDERTTPVCRFLDQRVFHPGQEGLEQLIPPNHFSCRSIIVGVVAGEEIDPAAFLSADEVTHAKSLADAKFLAQEQVALSVARPPVEPAAPQITEVLVERLPDGKVKATVVKKKATKKKGGGDG